MTPLTFDEATHTYRTGSIVLPSVTQVLASLNDFSMVAPDVLERKRQIGTAVHAAVALDLDDDLDESTVADAWAGRFKAWRQFRRDIDFDDAHPFRAPGLAHPKLGFAGTPDIAVLMDDWAVIEIKTADDLSPSWALQTAAYLELINMNATPEQERVRDRFSLRLLDNGQYRLDRFKSKTDWGFFLSFLSVHKFTKEHAK